MDTTLVQVNIGASLHIGIEQPIYDEQGAFDVVELSERQSKFMLTRV